MGSARVQSTGPGPRSPLALPGTPAEAGEAAATALAIYETTGDLPASGWARQLLDSLSG